MDARSTTDELSRLGALPELDDPQLEFMVSELSSSDSWIDQVDGGYGSLYSEQFEIKVSECAELALSKAGARVLPRLLPRLRRAKGATRQGLFKVLARADAKGWATLSLKQRTEALHLVELAVGNVERPFATLAFDDDQVKDPVARARDLISLRLLALDAAETGVERAVEPVVQALQSVSHTVRTAAGEVVPFLRASTRLGPRLIDAFVASRDSSVFMLTYGLTKALEALEVPRTDAERAQLEALIDDGKLGDSARQLLTRGLSKDEAARKYPYSEQRLAADARGLVTNSNEGAWRDALSRFGHAALGAALLPAMREALVARSVTDEILRHLSLVGPSVAPLADALAPYLSPATSPSGRHVRAAISVAEAMKSPHTVPALEALVKTDYGSRATAALTAIRGKG